MHVPPNRKIKLAVDRDFKKYGLEIGAVNAKGEARCTCPKCSATRGNPDDPSCSVNVESGLWVCHHCGAQGYVPSAEEEEQREARQRERERGLSGQRRPYKRSRLRVQPTRHKTYNRPAWTEPQSYELESSVARYVLSRGLDLAVGRQLRVTSGVMAFARNEQKLDASGQMTKQKVWDQKHCLQFNYFEQGVLINQKWRSLDKEFRLVSGAELIPWNIDSIRGERYCCITEGEFDTWALVQAGYPYSISVPNGGAGSSEWLDRFIESHFDDKEQIILALDDDEVGRKMRDELVRRLGFNRCYVVSWHEGVKDANEELQKHGVEGIRSCIESAQLVPLQNTFTAADVEEEVIDLFHNGVKSGLKVGIENFDKLMTFEPGRFMVCTGRPGDGKSEFIDELVLRLALHHGWKACYFSPENVPVTYHVRKLSERLLARPFQPSASMTEEMARAAVRWQSENICYIMENQMDTTARTTSSQSSDNVAERQKSLDRMVEEDLEGSEAWRNPFDVFDVLQCVHRAVVRCGIRVAVLDPLNRIDYSSLPGDSEYARLNNLIQILSQFAVHHGILLILVAHPRKVNRSEFSGQRRHVEMNDISGTADFGSKCDYCLVIDRDDERKVVTAYVEKVKFKHLGTRGSATLHYIQSSGRYVPCTVTRIPPDLSDPESKATYRKEVDMRGSEVAWI